MLRGINRFAFSVAFLLCVTMSPLAHAPDLYRGSDHLQRSQPVSAAGTHDDSNFLSTQRRPDFRPVAVPHAAVANFGASSFHHDRVGILTPGRPGNSYARPRPATGSSRRGVRSKPGTSAFLPAASSRVLAFSTNYYEYTGRRLPITSEYRTPYLQARAIHRNLRAYGTPYVLRLYRRRAAIREIVSVYNRNRKRPGRAIGLMTRVIQAQVRRGVYISAHMRGLAIDVRSRGRHGAKLSALRAVARSMGARVLVERNHYHVEL